MNTRLKSCLLPARTFPHLATGLPANAPVSSAANLLSKGRILPLIPPPIRSLIHLIHLKTPDYSRFLHFFPALNQNQPPAGQPSPPKTRIAARLGKPVANSPEVCDLFSILMRYGTVWVAVVLLVATGSVRAADGDRPEALARWHFAGTDRLKELKNQKPLQAILDLPETAALRGTALAALSSRAAARFAKEGANPSEQAGRIKELLPDLLRFESRFLLARTPAGQAEWALALKMPPDREADWRKRLGELARAAGLQVTDGPDWSAAHDKYRLSLRREGDWTLLRGGYFEAGPEPKALREFRNDLGKSAGPAVLTAELNFPELGELWKAPRLSHAPRVLVQATPNGDGFRSDLKLLYPRDLGIEPEPWNVPTSLFREPIIGFTAVQGVAEALRGSAHLQAMGLAKVPNQVFAWSVGDTPFSTYLAADVGNPKEVLKNIVDKLIPELRRSAGPALAGQPQVSSNGTTVAWRGVLPVAVPFAQVGRAPVSDYLVLGLFPVARGGATDSNAVPSELFGQLKKKNLIYYEWEITEGRLSQWRPIWQIAQMTSPEKILQSDSPSVRWLAAITPKLGNTVTEATLANGREIRVVRQSHLGFNALELVLMAHWADPHDVRQLGDGQRSGPAPAGNQPGKNGAPKNAETGR